MTAKVALVTGAAQGMERACVDAFVGDGWKVIAAVGQYQFRRSCPCAGHFAAAGQDQFMTLAQLASLASCIDMPSELPWN